VEASFDSYYYTKGIVGIMEEELARRNMEVPEYNFGRSIRDIKVKSVENFHGSRIIELNHSDEIYVGGGVEWWKD
jgi:hypothetical protein